jgi:hypothetical protein
MNENQTSTSESHTNNAPSRCNQNEKAKEKKQSKRKQKFTPKKQKLKNNDLDSNQDKEVCRPLMTFTKVFTQLMRREEQCMGFKLHSTGKTQ